ncbi:MAG: flagellar protein FliT [Chloroflexi bacterium]|nr:flagellar protein FliT [Chloroflexota bacterium]
MKTESDEMDLDAAIHICDELLRLAEAQRQAIGEDDVDRVNQLLDRRNELILSLDLEAARNPNTNLSAVGNQVSSKQSLAVEKLKQLLHFDEENRKALQIRLAEVRDQLSAVNRGRRALQEYAYLNPQPEPVYIDRRR